MIKVIYHKGCNDGLCSLWLMSQWLASQGKEIGGTLALAHGPGDAEAIDTFVENGDDVFIVDYCPDQIEELADRCWTLTIIDHHIGRKALLDGAHAINLTKHFDVDRCASQLIYNSFIEGTPLGNYSLERFVAYVNDRDLWLHQYENTDAVAAALRLVEKDRLGIWKLHMDREMLARLVSDGGLLLRYDAIKMASIKESTRTVSVTVDSVPYICTYTICSDYHIVSRVLGDLVIQHGLPAIARVTLDKYSVRSNDSCVVTARQIASTFGGNGHDHAAGFNSKEALG